ncbi:MAG: DUF4124 domain-containing protein [Pseudomonadota bacterium]
MKSTIPFVISFCFALAFNQAMADKLYKWTDAKGVTHYSQHPAANVKNEVIIPKTGHSDPVTPTASASTANTNSSAAAKASLKDPERCANARKNLDTLKTFARIKVKEENGEFRYLTPDEQKQKIGEANKAIEESCN